MAPSQAVRITIKELLDVVNSKTSWGRNELKEAIAQVHINVLERLDQANEPKVPMQQIEE